MNMSRIQEQLPAKNNSLGLRKVLCFSLLALKIYSRLPLIGHVRDPSDVELPVIPVYQVIRINTILYIIRISLSLARSPNVRR